MEATWPNSDVAYQSPVAVVDAQQRWQKAIDEALKTSSLRLVPDGGDYYNLVGECPRCGHEMAQSIEWTIYVPNADGIGVMVDVPARMFRGPSEGESETDEFEIVCTCSEKHPPRDDKEKGCGWGRGLTVTLNKPAGD